MNNSQPLLRRKWFIVPAACLLVGALDLGRGYLQALSLDQSFSWQECAPVTFFFFGLWALAAPLVLTGAERYPVLRENWGRRISAHAALAVALGLTLRLAVEFFIFKTALAPASAFVAPATLFSAAGKIGFDVLAYFILLGLFHAFEYLRNFESEQLRAARLQTQLAQARQHTLRLQFPPDFLLRAHEAAIALMNKSENEKAIALLAQLGELLRARLERNGAPANPAQNDLESFEQQWRAQPYERGLEAISRTAG